MLLSLWAGTFANCGEQTGVMVRVPHWPHFPARAQLPSSMFGLNIHLNWGFPYSGQTVTSYAATANDLGIGWYRTDVHDYSSAAFAVPYFDYLRKHGVEPFPVITNVPGWSWDYETSYRIAYSVGAQVSLGLKGYATWFETSNELDYFVRTDSGTGLPRTITANGTTVGWIDGSQPTDFDASRIETFCGWNMGMADGIRSNIPDAKIGFATGTAFGGYIMGEMLQKGMDRDGTYCRPCCKVDFHGLHWYDGMGDPRGAGQVVGSVSFVVNVFQEAWRRMGVGTVISEWGSNHAETAQATYITNMGTEYLTHRNDDHIIQANLYALFGNSSADDWGVIKMDGSTHKAAYSALDALTQLG